MNMHDARSSVRSLVEAIEEEIAFWEGDNDLLAMDAIEEVKPLGPRVEDRLNALRGLDADTADRYQWCLSL